MKRTSISLIEDEAHTADMLLRLLATADEFRVAGHYTTAEEALADLPAIAPDMILVDLMLPVMRGVECIRHLKSLLPDSLCLVVTQFDDSDLLFTALQAGADGYLLKRATDHEILDGIRNVRDGGGAMSPSI